MNSGFPLHKKTDQIMKKQRNEIMKLGFHATRKLGNSNLKNRDKAQPSISGEWFLNPRTKQS